jgi:hypothetical protein
MCIYDRLPLTRRRKADCRSTPRRHDPHTLSPPLGDCLSKEKDSPKKAVKRRKRIF